MAGPHVAAYVFIGLSWTLALAWVWQAIAALRGIPKLHDLTQIDPDSLPPLTSSKGPHLSVIVPARNEQSAIEATLRSLTASIGIRLQILCVDDRSTDSTGERMDKIAADVSSVPGPHSLDVLHIDKLPAGWLGKPHAMALAARQATAPWLLFTDGDVVFHPQALELALRKALATNADNLTLVPSMILQSPGERAMLATMQVLAQWTIRLWKIADPKARDFIGVGGFNLVHRNAYNQIGGFESLRMEVLDDMRFGWNVKRAGLSQQVVLGPGLACIRWIHGAGAVIRLLEKNGFAVYRFRVGVHLMACLGLVVQAVLPIAAIAAGGWAMIGGLTTYAAFFFVYFANRRVTNVSSFYAVFFAPATAIVAYALFRSMILTLVRDGVDWRGTRYALSELRRNAGPMWW